jgi:hypothetical protein
MPTETTCPACGRVVPVADEAGRPATCPACAAPLPAPDGGPVDAFREAPDRPPPVRTDDDPPRRPKPQLDPEGDYDDEFDDDDDDDLDERMEERRKARRKRQRGERAKAKVAAPAIGLMVVGGLNLAGVLVFIALAFYFAIALPPGVGGPPAAGLGGLGIGEIYAIAFGVGAVFSLVFGGLILYGAIRMKQMRMYGMALTACVLTTVMALGSCCFGAFGVIGLALGLSFSIWGFIVLSDADVKAAFK